MLFKFVENKIKFFTCIKKKLKFDYLRNFGYNHAYTHAFIIKRKKFGYGEKFVVEGGNKL